MLKGISEHIGITFYHIVIPVHQTNIRGVGGQETGFHPVVSIWFGINVVQKSSVKKKTTTAL